MAFRSQDIVPLCVVCREQATASRARCRGAACVAHAAREMTCCGQCESPCAVCDRPTRNACSGCHVAACDDDRYGHGLCADCHESWQSVVAANSVWAWARPFLWLALLTPLGLLGKSANGVLALLAAPAILGVLLYSMPTLAISLPAARRRRREFLRPLPETRLLAGAVPPGGNSS